MLTLIYVILGRHCQTNFCNFKRMTRSMISVWGSIESRYDLIILDYFFSPSGWANTRWNEKFFSESLPGFVKKKILKDTGTIWIPNVTHVNDSIEAHREILQEYYSWDVINDPFENPLYEATDMVENELLECPDNITNSTQKKYLDSDGHFIRLKPKAM